MHVEFAIAPRPEPVRDDRHEVERALARRASEGCAESLGQLVQRNLGFVHWIARDYRSHGLPFEDLVGEGRLGLVEAARRFDADRGVQFTTYASWWVRKTIRLALDGARGPAPPRDRTRGPTERPRPARQLRPETLLAARPHDALEAAGADGAPDAEETLLAEESKRRVRDAVARLAPVERRVVVRRFGLDGIPARTLQQAGRELGLSGERVRQIEGRALDRLRRSLAAIACRRRDRPAAASPRRS